MRNPTTFSWIILLTVCLRCGVALADNDSLINLSQRAQLAIDHGVTIVLNSDYRPTGKSLLWQLSDHRKGHRFSIERHSLSNRYAVSLDDDFVPRVFRSIPRAVDYVASKSLLLLESYSGKQQKYEMRISLNKYELPSPMRLKAFFSDDWDNDTGWLVWQSKG